MIDKDGKFSYSKVISLTSIATHPISVYPNPAANTITINTNGAGSFHAGYKMRFGLTDSENRALTIIHELAHAAVYIFGKNASSIIDDTSDAVKSLANSQKVYEKCFRGRQFEGQIF